MRKKTTIRFTPFEKEMIKKIADYLNWTNTEVIRRSLRFGLNSLLKFETNKKMDLSKLLSSMVQSKDDQENNKPGEEKNKPLGWNPPKTPEEEEQLKKDIEIAKTKWLED